ncbi:AraC family transcriptional regulator [Methyloceanibacter caenitepidi]|uniref:Transcriptional regulator, AraC family n=1 Tax=Methyloceanibacter caenitepidi TaxID=1384459 RepID=A0A0A8K3T5_9HYPH|nr:AraC family transcriptional regulator [Methyloceanibacter caenitepidi]BAQ17570.1 transcriptional regulator, AraC family [Methyloceanibacter caenitepidi]
MSAHPSQLASLIDRFAKTDGIHETAVPRLSLIRCSRPTLPLHAVYEPAVCIIAQGSKQAILGDAVYVYDQNKYLVISVGVPVVGQITEASDAEPYLCVKFDLDIATLGMLLLDTRPGPDSGEPAPALGLSKVTPELTDAAVRLLRLLETPPDIPILAPLFERELLFRLLQGDQAAKLREIALGDTRLQQVGRAIDYIKRNYREPFRVEDLAGLARMSASALHSHFKAVTAMSPLQYQKQMRLQEARRLMLQGLCDAAAASHSVGYSSPSQFSREYRRLFGLPPQRDIARLKEVPGGFVSA